MARKKRQFWTPEEYVEIWKYDQCHGRVALKKKYDFTRGAADSLVYRLKGAIAGKRVVGNIALGKAMKAAGKVIRSESKDVRVAGARPMNPYQSLTKLTEGFQSELIKIIAQLVKEGQEKALKKAYLEGFDKGRQAEEKRLVESARKTDAGNRLMRALGVQLRN